MAPVVLVTQADNSMGDEPTAAPIEPGSETARAPHADLATPSAASEGTDEGVNGALAGADRESKRRLRRLLLWGAAGMVLIPTACMVALVWFARDEPDRLRPSRPIAGRTRTELPLDGRWDVVAGSRAGYRVAERFVAMPNTTEAVGRTTEIDGQFDLEETGDDVRLIGGEFTVGMDSLTSEQPERDEALRTKGLETDRFTTARFVVDGELDVPAEALRHRLVRLEIPGELTLHGVTRSVQFDVEAQLLADGTVELTAAQSIELADYDIERLSVARVLRIEPTATIEFQLLARRATQP